MNFDQKLTEALNSKVQLFHGTSASLLPSIMKTGIRLSPNEVWPESPSVSCVDSLKKAKVVADYFADGVVLEFWADPGDLEYHPDYGGGPEFDTIHCMRVVPPGAIKVHRVDAGGGNRPAGSKLRQWKGGS